MTPARAIAAATLGAAALLAWRQWSTTRAPVQAGELQALELAGEPAPDQAQPGAVLGLGFGFDVGQAWDSASSAAADAVAAVNPFAYMAGATAARDATADNVAAFLAMIAAAEGTDRGADPYRVCYGYRHTIRDLSDHPAITGEWRGEPLDSLGAAYAGKVSTAAGRYQIIRPTWQAARRALALPDFGPASQDAAAVWLIDRKPGALDAVKAGDLATAVALCASTWASLPGAGYGQPERRMAWLSERFTTAGGTLS